MPITLSMDLFDKFESKSESFAKLFYIIVGNIIFAVTVNMLITPMDLYNGGFLGIAQLLRHFFNSIGFALPEGFDMTGIIYFLMNVPLFYFAYRQIGRGFAIKSLISIGISSLFLTLVPVPQAPLFDDYLTACVVGGVIGGLGCGMILRGGASTGGSDIIGVCLANKHHNVSVGTINIFVNILVYGICLIAFNVQIAIYSFIYTAIRSIFVDKMHTQNINSQVIIVTKIEGIDKAITKKLGRGVTSWDGKGAYTDQQVHVMIVGLTKYEMGHLKDIVLELDPHAFMMQSDNEYIVGNFKKHFE